MVSDATCQGSPNQTEASGGPMFHYKTDGLLAFSTAVSIDSGLMNTILHQATKIKYMLSSKRGNGETNKDRISLKT